ncbi:MAG: BACON domain-containing protein [Lutibacter sp.]
MDVSIYIQGEQIDLFDDENIVMNLNVKNLSDISKLISDFTQGFHTPTSDRNNKIFTYWFNADLDGTFNANLRVDAYIEVNSLPYKYGTIQMDSAVMKNGLPYSYELTFYSKGISLNDAFGDDTLRALSFTAYNHSYNASNVYGAMNGRTIASGDLFYPMINAVQDMSIANDVNSTNLISATNNIRYTDFKPAIRIIRIIEAIEEKYTVQFSREFFDRAIFHNIFMWLHSETGAMKAYGEQLTVDIPTDYTENGFVFSATNDTITFDNAGGDKNFRKVTLTVIPETGFSTVPYKIICYNLNEVVSEVEAVGFGTAIIDIKGSNIAKFAVKSSEDFDFHTKIDGWQKEKVFLGINNSHVIRNTATQTISASVIVSEQMPDMKIKDFFASLISEFNLIIKDGDNDIFTIDTLDNWYSKGKVYDITKLIDLKDIKLKKPDIKKQIDFMYQKTDTILGKSYYDNYQVGYGDLKAKYDINGSDLKIESQFENMMFERLQNETTGDITDIQVGYAIDKELKPAKGKPFLFYRNAYVDSSATIYIQPTGTFTRLFHTATEDNLEALQVTNSLNFGADNSTFFLSPIEKSLYFNFWKTYIDDIYNPKTRVVELKCTLPSFLLYNLKLNDKLIISQNKYKIITAKINLINGETNIELMTDYSLQLDSDANVIPITVDSTLITVDSTAYTVDMVSVHVPVTSYIVNSVSMDEYLSTASEEHFEVRITANTNWAIVNEDTGYGNTWFTSNKMIGSKSDYLRVTVSENTGTYREGNMNISIGGIVSTIRIMQTP